MLLAYKINRLQIRLYCIDLQDESRSLFAVVSSSWSQTPSLSFSPCVAGLSRPAAASQTAQTTTTASFSRRSRISDAQWSQIFLSESVYKATLLSSLNYIGKQTHYGFRRQT